MPANLGPSLGGSRSAQADLCGSLRFQGLKSGRIERQIADRAINTLIQIYISAHLMMVF